jgi:hypothetical protein
MAGRAKKPGAVETPKAEKEQRNKRGNRRGTAEASKANLKPFEPGQSGNPDGLPKGTKQRGTIAAKWLGTEMIGFNPIEKKRQRLTVEDFLTLSMISAAFLKKDVRGYLAIMDSAYGKVAQPITGGDGQPLMQPIADALATIYGDDDPNGTAE